MTKQSGKVVKLGGNSYRVNYSKKGKMRFLSFASLNEAANWGNRRQRRAARAELRKRGYKV